MDAIWSGYANKSKLAEYGFEQMLKQEDLGVYQDSIYVTSQNYLDEKKEALIRYLQATAETYEFIRSNFDKAVDDIVTATGMERQMAVDSLGGTTLTLDFSADFVRDLSDLDQWMIENGYYTQNLDLDHFYAPDVLKEALPEAEIYR